MKRKIKFPATRMVVTHKVDYACEKHAYRIVRLMNFMGAGAQILPYDKNDKECMNCVNENKEKTK